MNIRISITPAAIASSFADVALHIEGDTTPCRLRLDRKTLQCLGRLPSDTALDLLLLATTVYSLDRRVRREQAVDAWTRQFAVDVPVLELDRWKSAEPLVNQCLSFLTGDVWDVTFSKRSQALVAPVFYQRLPLGREVQAVSLFSGGLDSLIGIIDYLVSHSDASLLLVGHHDPRMAGVLGGQQVVFEELEQHYPGRILSVLPWIGADSGKDTTLLSRSFLFLALGIYAAQTISDTTPVLIPENGTIALNVPLTPSRTGSCSTRTTHPYYLVLMQEILRTVGLSTTITNPLETKTKGECVVECLNRSLLVQLAPLTVSCAKSGHTRTWYRRQAKQCGRCMPCIYRRAALHTLGLDTEVYGRDFCRGEVDVFSDNESADDFRACVSFLHNNYSQEQIAELLLENGRLDLNQLPGYADIVRRAMEEVRALLRDKATPEVKALAGL